MGAERFYCILIVSFLLIGSICMVLPSGAEEDGRALDETIMFSEAGVDKSMTREFVKGSTVTTATMTVKGLSILWLNSTAKS